MHYTPSTISSGAGVYPLHDTVVIDPASIFTQLFHQSRRFHRYFLKSKSLQKALPSDLVKTMKSAHYASFPLLSAFYQRQRGWENFRHSTEPDWFTLLDSNYRRILNVSHAMDEGSDPLAILPHLPFHGIGYVIEEGGLIQDLSNFFGVTRLRGIRQLAYLHDPQTSNSWRQVETNFGHCRLVHSYDTAVVANLILVNNPELEPLATQIRIGSFLHDILTPAGGDTTKIIDRKAFDEDQHFLEILEPQQWEDFSRASCVQAVSLSEMIMGKGICGRILDLCDKSTYMARDLDAFLRKGAQNGPSHYPDTYLPLLQIARENPCVCALWAHVKVKDGKLVITDPEALHRFLLVRARLFRGLYWNPYSRILESIIAKKFIGWAYHTSQVSREILLTWKDSELSHWLTRITGLDLFTSVLDYCGVEQFDDKPTAERRQAELDADPDTLTVLEEFAPQTGDGTASFSVEKNGKIVTFKEAFPEWSASICSIMVEPSARFRLYRASMDGLRVNRDSALRQKLKAFQCPAALMRPTVYGPLKPMKVRWHEAISLLYEKSEGEGERSRNITAA